MTLPILVADDGGVDGAATSAVYCRCQFLAISLVAFDLYVQETRTAKANKKH